MTRRLVDLDPRWLLKDGRRTGLIFICPTDARWRQTCFFEPTPLHDQERLVHAAVTDLADDDGAFDDWQPCRTGVAWTVAGSPVVADFDALSITPSIDGSAGGLWHGFITNGECTP